MKENLKLITIPISLMILLYVYNEILYPKNTLTTFQYKIIQNNKVIGYSYLYPCRESDCIKVYNKNKQEISICGTYIIVKELK